MDKIFPYRIHKLKVPNYETLNKKLTSEIQEIKGNDKNGILRSNKGGWHSKDYFTYQDSDRTFKDLTKIISDYYSEIIFQNKKYILLSHLWANINTKGNFNSPHNHPNSHYSGVYYVKVPKNSGNLYFVDMPFDIDLKEIIPEEGSLYMWQSHLLHRVGENLTDDDRMSISFNFGLGDIKKQLKEQDDR